MTLLIVVQFLFESNLSAQIKLCNYCSKEISGNYTIVEGRYYHPDHFYCYHCKKPINHDYNKYNKKYFHISCYQEVFGEKCTVCNKPIEGKYYIKDNQKLHEDCYTRNSAEICAVCVKPLIGKYLVDVYSTKYHPRHENELPKCDNCNRIISRNTTKGGTRYSDGRYLCNICFRQAVSGYNNINSIFKKVALKLNKLGLYIKLQKVEVYNVDRNELKKIAKENFHSSMRGYCNTITQKVTERGTVSIIKSFKVYLIEGIPSEYIESTAAHEIMHIWIAQNTTIDHNLKLEEGSCNYISYLYMRYREGKTAETIVKIIDTDPHPIYGGGFREIKKRFNFKPIDSLLNFLKHKSYL